MLPSAPQLDPYRITDDTWIIPELMTAGPDALIAVNSMVVAGDEPTIVDTGGTLNRERWMESVFSIVDPADVRWIFLSHDDHDHVGNLLPALDACPQATLVTNWFSIERLRTEFELPLSRCRWVNDGDSFDAGDRTFLAVLPPVFDSPTTRGLFDTSTGVYWAADCFASLLTHPVTMAQELDPDFWAETFLQLHSFLTPWHALLDMAKFDAHVDRTEALGASAIASAHGAVLHDVMIKEAIEMVRQLARMERRPVPGQGDLEAILAAAAASG
ncbi:MAG: MBL fold metallo-hydrolase [Acidimicrobiia bacterium]